MLPEGFEWDDGIDSADHVRLFLNGHIIASVTVLPNGSARICQHPDNTRRSYRFKPDRPTGIRYLEDWACKWADQLRAEYPPQTAKLRPPLPPEWL